MTKSISQIFPNPKVPLQPSVQHKKRSLDSDSFTSVFFPWHRYREPPIYSNDQTCHTVSPSEFYLFYVAVLLLILVVGLTSISVWSIVFKVPFHLLIDTSTELGYFALSDAVLCLLSFWIVVSVHNDGKSHRFLPLVLVLLTFAIVLMVIGVYIGSTHKLHLKLNQIETSSILSEFRNNMKQSLLRYEKNRKIWDQVQATLGCCGIDNCTDWFLVLNHLPKSCCKVTCQGNSTTSPPCLKIITTSLALQTRLFNGINCVALFTQCWTFVAVSIIYFFGKRSGVEV